MPHPANNTTLEASAHASRINGNAAKIQDRRYSDSSRSDWRRSRAFNGRSEAQRDVDDQPLHSFAPKKISRMQTAAI